eukprot:6204917-Pleurochrysis_carterae.AAC.4
MHKSGGRSCGAASFIDAWLRSFAYLDAATRAWGDLGALRGFTSASPLRIVNVECAECHDSSPMLRCNGAEAEIRQRQMEDDSEMVQTAPVAQPRQRGRFHGSK